MAQNSTVGEITQHKYSSLMATSYLIRSHLLWVIKLGQESLRLSSSSGPSGLSNGDQQAGKLLAQNSTVGEITQHKYNGLMGVSNYTK